MPRPIPLPRGVVLNRATFLLSYGLFLRAHRILHFRAYEACDVGRRKRKGGRVVATLQPPPLELWVPSLDLWRKLEWLRDQAGGRSVHLSSGYRDPVYNLAIGGVDDSTHTYLIAGDLTVDGWSPLRTAQVLASHPDAHLLGIGLYQTFTHLDVRGMVPPGFLREPKPIPGRWFGKGVQRWW